MTLYIGIDTRTKALAITTSIIRIEDFLVDALGHNEYFALNNRADAEKVGITPSGFDLVAIWDEYSKRWA